LIKCIANPTRVGETDITGCLVSTTPPAKTAFLPQYPYPPTNTHLFHTHKKPIKHPYPITKPEKYQGN